MSDCLIVEQPKKKRGRKLGSRNREGHHAGRPKGSFGKLKKELLESTERLQSSVWHGGRAEITVAQKYISAAMERNSSHCATADAIKEQVPEARHISVDLQTIRWTDSKKGVRYVFLTPHAIQTDIIIPFDQGDRENCKPVTVRMKPAYVCKSGKKRTHTPTNDELKDAGLRVAKDQPHLPTPEPDPPASGAEKDLVQKWKPRSGDRDGALIAPPDDPEAKPEPEAPKPRKPRVARAKVSAVSKGVIPTTLGGKLPPVSVLSRREFGLRALRR
jgi:hypothetical protein